VFRLDTEELKKLAAWREEHDKTCKYAHPSKQGAIGGRLTYCFTPTSLGSVTKVKCACGEEVDLTDYDAW
jgi:hypothetical protein